MSSQKPLHTLVLEHSLALQRYFRRRRAGSHAADLAQEVCARLLRVQQPQDIRHPRAYLFKTALRLLQEYQASERRVMARRVPLTDALVRLEMVSESTLDQDVDEERYVARLRAVLRELPSRSRDVIHLVYQEERSFAEIGERLGISKAMVHKILAQALRHCYRRLQEGGEEV